MVVGVPGRLQRLDRRPPVSSGPFTISTPYRSTSSSSPATWSGCECVVSRCVTVRALALDDLVQRCERRAAVDEDGGSAGLVGEQVGVREPVGMHAPFDQHGWTVHGGKDRGPDGLSFSRGAHSRRRARPGLSYGTSGSVGRAEAGSGGPLAPAAPAAPVAAADGSGRAGGSDGSGTGSVTGSGGAVTGWRDTGGSARSSGVFATRPRARSASGRGSQPSLKWAPGP